MAITNAMSKRIEMLRFLMIFGVLVLHVPQYIPLSAVGSDWFSLTKAFFQHAVFRTTVPVLTFISGYLLFGSESDASPLDLWKKKFQTLVVPFLFFNLTLLAIAYLVQVEFAITMSYDLVHANTKTWLDAAFGLTQGPINYPLNFLRDMVVLIIMAPVLGVVLRNSPFLGLGTVLVIFLNNGDNNLVLRDTMVIQFYLGGLMAVKKVDMTKLDKYAKPLLVTFLMICVAVVKFKIENRTALVLMSPLFVWPASSLLVHTTLGKWLSANAKYSFFIFIAHAPVLMASWLVYQKVATHVSYQLYWVAIPFVLTALLIASHKFLMFIAPSFFAVVTGNRASKKKLVKKVAEPAMLKETMLEEVR